MPKERFQKTKKMYNRYHLEAMTNNLFPDQSTEMSVRDNFDGADSNRNSLKMRKHMEQGTFVLYDPHKKDENNYMIFKKRLT